MADDPLPADAADAPVRVGLLHVPAGKRPAIAALFALDAALAQVLRTTREPMIGQLRLAWWRDALTKLDEAPAPAEPALRAIADRVLPQDVRGAAVAALVDGWEELIDRTQPVDLDAYAAGRGGALFGLAATILGASDPAVAAAGAVWALADLASHAGDPKEAAAAWAAASARFAAAFARRWPRRLRPLGTIALLAWRDAGEPVSPLRLLRFSVLGG